MFRTVELGQKLSNKEYKEKEAQLREELYSLQYELFQQKKKSVLIIFGGVDGGGKRDCVKVLNSWMDARYIYTKAYVEPTQDEYERPEYWKYWRDLPPNGRVALFLSPWYFNPITKFIRGDSTQDEYESDLNRIRHFENNLVDSGSVIIKIWLHLSKNHQKKRLTELEKSKLTSWQVSKQDWKNWKDNDNYIYAAEKMILETHQSKTPWFLIDGSDRNFREIEVAELVKNALKTAIVSEENQTNTNEVIESSKKVEIGSVLKVKTVLETLRTDLVLNKDDYEKELIKQQNTLGKLQRELYEKGIRLVLAFEGPDAAGKGGAIKRIIQALNPRSYHIFPISAPTAEENSHHYLWRFWKTIPRKGHVAIYDRSWYGRVLVERVEGYATEKEWKRAYSEINDFEKQWVDNDSIVLKFWVHISEDEQFKRFQERENTPYKSWKITPEDWRNRNRWPDYELAVHDMIQYTGTNEAPWILVEGNDKKFARIKILKEINSQIRAVLKKKTS